MKLLQQTISTMKALYHQFNELQEQNTMLQQKLNCVSLELETLMDELCILSTTPKLMQQEYQHKIETKSYQDQIHQLEQQNIQNELLIESLTEQNNDNIMCELELLQLQKEHKRLQRRIQTHVGPNWDETKNWRRFWQQISRLKQSSTEMQTIKSLQKQVEQLHLQTAELEHKLIQSIDISPHILHLKNLFNNNGRCDINWMLDYLDWQRENDLSDKRARSIAIGLLKRILYRVDNGSIEDIIKIPSKTTVAKYRTVFVRIMQQRLGDEFRSKFKGVIIDGTSKKGVESLGMLVSSTDLETWESYHKFFDMREIKSKHGHVEAETLQLCFQNYNWHLSTLIWLTMDSASTNKTFQNELIKAKKKICIMEIQKGTFNSVTVLPPDVPKEIHDYFVIDSEDRWIDLHIYAQWDVMHKFKNAELHAMSKGFGNGTIPMAFNNEIKSNFVKTALGSISRLYQRFPVEVKALVSYFNGGIEPPAIPIDIKHKLKAWTLLAQWIDKYGYALMQGLQMVRDAYGSWTTSKKDLSHHCDVYFCLVDNRIRLYCKFLARMHSFSEDIYFWIQLVDGYCLSELRIKRDKCISILDDLIHRFDTEFGEVIQYADLLFKDKIEMNSAIKYIKEYLKVYRDYLQTEMAYLDLFPYKLAEFWNPQYGIENLRATLHLAEIYCLPNCKYCIELNKGNLNWIPWNIKQKLNNCYYALGLLVNPDYRIALIEAANQTSLTAIVRHIQDDDKLEPHSVTFFSLHPLLDQFYFEYIQLCAIHSLDAERLLARLSVRTLGGHRNSITYENKWFRLSKENDDLLYLKDLSLQQFSVTL